MKQYKRENVAHLSFPYKAKANKTFSSIPFFYYFCYIITDICSITTKWIII